MFVFCNNTSTDSAGGFHVFMIGALFFLRQTHWGHWHFSNRNSWKISKNIVPSWGKDAYNAGQGSWSETTKQQVQTIFVENILDTHDMVELLQDSSYKWNLAPKQLSMVSKLWWVKKEQWLNLLRFRLWLFQCFSGQNFHVLWTSWTSGFKVFSSRVRNIGIVDGLQLKLLVCVPFTCPGKTILGVWIWGGHFRLLCCYVSHLPPSSEEIKHKWTSSFTAKQKQQKHIKRTGVQTTGQCSLTNEGHFKSLWGRACLYGLQFPCLLTSSITSINGTVLLTWCRRT